MSNIDRSNQETRNRRGASDSDEGARSVEAHLERARVLRSEAFHDAFHDLWRGLWGSFRRKRRPGSAPLRTSQAADR